MSQHGQYGSNLAGLQGAVCQPLNWFISLQSVWRLRESLHLQSNNPALRLYLRPDDQCTQKGHDRSPPIHHQWTIHDRSVQKVFGTKCYLWLNFVQSTGDFGRAQGGSVTLCQLVFWLGWPAWPGADCQIGHQPIILPAHTRPCFFICSASFVDCFNFSFNRFVTF